ncbi:hypothetical protein SAMN04489740_4309 [Arthrobacter alpinus]|uniref:Uncharacterized protein n=1 Tax=Arthrobacter alpinus TaxID=656366 RepID=A0A1H5PGU7_9MICC|nr:hypothetical protein SAMN04489740_4309 [Arthrobacter alpinus]
MKPLGVDHVNLLWNHYRSFGLQELMNLVAGRESTR